MDSAPLLQLVPDLRQQLDLGRAFGRGLLFRLLDFGHRPLGVDHVARRGLIDQHLDRDEHARIWPRRQRRRFGKRTRHHLQAPFLHRLIQGHFHMCHGGDGVSLLEEDV